LRLLVAAAEPEEARERAPGVALRRPVARGREQLDRLALRADRLLELVRQVALERVAGEQLRPLAAQPPARDRERAPVLLRRLAVRAEGGRARAGRRRVPEQRLGIAGRVGVVDEP